MRESLIEQYLIRRVRERNGEVRKVNWVGRRGAPDRLVMLPGRIIWVELKAPGKKPEGHQRREHERLRKYGANVVVVDTPAAVDEMLR